MIINRLQELLHSTGTSQRELARALGIRPNTVSEYVRNEVIRPDLRIVEKICRYFAIEVSDFFYDDGKEYDSRRG